MSTERSDRELEEALLFPRLTTSLDVMNKKCEERKKEISMTGILTRTEDVVHGFIEEMKRIQQEAFKKLQSVYNEHERCKSVLENERKTLKLSEEELKQREALSESEKRKFDKEKEMNERALCEHKKWGEKMMQLAIEQKRERDEHRKRITELQSQLAKKQMLQLEIESKKGAIEMMRHMYKDGDTEGMKKLECLKDKVEELEELERTNQMNIMIKEHKVNVELRDARKELIQRVLSLGDLPNMSIKYMGELDDKPFGKNEDLYSSWDDHLRDPSWHPFKIITEGDKVKEEIDEDDEKLVRLKKEVGEAAYEAMKTALKEMNEYNPSGRYPVRELWNPKEGKKMEITEAAAYLIQRWKQHRKKIRR